MKRISIALLLVLSFALSNCSDDSSNSPNNPDEIIPLKVGNYWINTLTALDPDGTIKMSYPDSMIVVGMKKINSEDVYQLKRNLFGEMIDYDWVNKPDGQYSMFINPDGTYYSALVYKYPIKTGEQFISVDTIATLLSSDQLIKVPAGDFRCYVYEKKVIQNNHFLKVITNITPNIGVIYQEFWESPDEKESNAIKKGYLSLIDYQVK